MGSLQDEVREVAQIWTKDYNHHRPHDALGGQSPVMWKSGQQSQAKASAFPDRFSTSDNNSKISRKKLLLKCTENGEPTLNTIFQHLHQTK